MDTQKYTITFELFNGQLLTREIYDGNVKISELFLKLKINYDWVQELNLDSQWIVESRGTKKVFSQCEDSISTILGDQHQDTFTFQKNGTIGLEIFLWQLQLQNIVQTQTSFDIESIISYMQLGEQLFTELDYYEALLCYFNVLSLDPKNQQALSGLGNCLAYLECEKCLAVYEILLKQNPDNNEYKFQKARGLNLLKRHQEAQIILNQLEKTNFGKNSYVQQEIATTQQKLGIVDKSYNRQQQITEKQNQKNNNMIKKQNQEDESRLEQLNLLVEQVRAARENQENNDQNECDDLSQEQGIDDQNNQQNNENNNENNQIQNTDVQNQNIVESVDDKQDSPSHNQDGQNNPEN